MTAASDDNVRTGVRPLAADSAPPEYGIALRARKQVDSMKWTVRALLRLASHEDAVYLVRSVDDVLDRLGFALSLDFRGLSAESLCKFSRIAGDQVKSAHVTGHGGAFHLSADEHRALMASGNFMDAMLAISKGLFPEEVIQRAIGAEVRLSVNGV